MVNLAPSETHHYCGRFLVCLDQLHYQPENVIRVLGLLKLQEASGSSLIFLLCLDEQGVKIRFAHLLFA